MSQQTLECNPGAFTEDRISPAVGRSGYAARKTQCGRHPGAAETSFRADGAFTIYVLSGWIEQMDTQLEEAAEAYDELVERFCDICGVGIQTALAYIVTIENPYRFRHSKRVGAYFWLAPSVSNSGNEETDDNQTGSITTEGDELVRSLLVQAAHTMLRADQRDSELRRFGKRIDAKKGKHKAGRGPGPQTQCGDAYPLGDRSGLQSILPRQPLRRRGRGELSPRRGLDGYVS